MITLCQLITFRNSIDCNKLFEYKRWTCDCCSAKLEKDKTTIIFACIVIIRMDHTYSNVILLFHVFFLFNASFYSISKSYFPQHNNTKKVSGDSFAKWQKMALLNSQFSEVRIMPYKFIKVGVHCFTAFNFRIKMLFPISFG